MAIISLRAYNHEIEGMIDNGQLDEAVAHCRHILATFPKHIATYRLLGKTHLEQQRISDATDIFQRVLSAVPDDFISNVGMSIIREDENNLDAAIWHMELAYEAQPANVAIQDELRRLYGRRDGMQPPKVRLTRGALARMYAKGGLYDQAIGELRAAIAEDPNRPDLQLLLAQMFFQTSQRVEAVDTCVNILKKMPLCLEANRILAVSLPDSEGSDVVRNARQTVVSMDPYYAFAEPEAISADQVADSAVNVERLEWKSGIQVGEAPQQPSWATSLGISLDKQADENIPEWLKAAEAPVAASPAEKTSPSVSPFIWDTQEVEKIITDTSTTEGELPDWMKDAGWKPASGEATQAPAELNLSEEASAGATSPGEAVQADIPDWLQGIAPDGFVTNAPPSIQAEEDKISNPWLEPHQPGPTDSIIHWLDEEKKPNVPVSPAAIGASDSFDVEDEVPDWLKDIDITQPATASEDESSLAAAAAFTAGISAFMEGREPPPPPAPAAAVAEGLHSGLDAEPEEAVTQPVPVPAPAEIEAPALATAEDELPDWLKGLAPEIPPAETLPAAEPVVEVEVPEALPSMETPIEAELANIEEQQPVEEAPESHLPAVAGAFIAAELLSKPETEPEITPLPEPMPTVEEPLPAAPIIASAAFNEAISSIEEAPAVQEVEPAVEGITAGAEITPAEPESIPEPEAFAWLKGLTDQQDASLPEELVLPGPEGEVQPPDWVKLELEPVTDELAHPVPSAPVEELPDWIKGLGEEAEAEQPAAALEEPALPEAEPIEEGELPAWLVDMSQPEAEKEAPGTAEEPLEWEPEELPDWLKEITEAEQPQQAAPAPESQAGEIIAAAAVVASLAGKQEPAPAPAPSEAAVEAPLPEIASVAAVEALAQPVAEIPAEPVAVEEPLAPEVQAEAAVTPAIVQEAGEPTEELTSENTLSNARIALKEGQPSQAAVYYAGLIKQNYRLDEVIKDLQEALYRYPVDINMWVTLGDAHSKTNDLQEALNAYNKAEELVR